MQEHYIMHVGYLSSAAFFFHIKLLPLHLFLFFTDAQLVATLMLQLFPQRLEWCLCCRHRRARGEHSERMMHGRLLSDALIFFPRVEILLRSPLPVLQLSGCDKLMAPGAQQHAGNHSNTDACSLHGSLDSSQRSVHLSF